MPWNGTGTYNLPQPAATPLTGSIISSADYISVLNDLQAAMNNVLPRDGQAAMTGPLALGGQNITGVSQINSNIIVNSSQVLANWFQFSGAEVTSIDRIIGNYRSLSWIPTGNVVSLSNVSGRFTKIGRLCFASFKATWPVTADTNPAQILGLPYASLNVAGHPPGAGVLTVSPAFTTMNVPPNVTYAELFGAGGVAMTNATLSNNTLSGFIIYQSQV